MLHTLFEELAALPLKHYALGMTDEQTILLQACTSDKEGIEEAMLVKEYASKYDVVIKWDGKHIEIY